MGWGDKKQKMQQNAFDNSENMQYYSHHLQFAALI
jgi:hypothetical protein